MSLRSLTAGSTHEHFSGNGDIMGIAAAPTHHAELLESDRQKRPTGNPDRPC